MLAAVVEHQHHNDGILGEDKERLAIGAKGEIVADIIDERDEVAGRFEEVGGEGDARGGLGADEVDDLGHLDKGGGADNGYAQNLGDGELVAVKVEDVNVEDEGGVALLAQEGFAKVADKGRQVVSDGLQDGLDGCLCRLQSTHCSVHGWCVACDFVPVDFGGGGRKEGNPLLARFGFGASSAEADANCLETQKKN